MPSTASCQRNCYLVLFAFAACLLSGCKTAPTSIHPSKEDRAAIRGLMVIFVNHAPDKSFYQDFYLGGTHYQVAAPRADLVLQYLQTHYAKILPQDERVPEKFAQVFNAASQGKRSLTLVAADQKSNAGFINEKTIGDGIRANAATMHQLGLNGVLYFQFWPQVDNDGISLACRTQIWLNDKDACIYRHELRAKTVKLEDSEFEKATVNEQSSAAVRATYDKLLNDAAADVMNVFAQSN